MSLSVLKLMKNLFVAGLIAATSYVGAEIICEDSADFEAGFGCGCNKSSSWNNSSWNNSSCSKSSCGWGSSWSNGKSDSCSCKCKTRHNPFTCVFKKSENCFCTFEWVDTYFDGAQTAFFGVVDSYFVTDPAANITTNYRAAALGDLNDNITGLANLFSQCSACDTLLLTGTVSFDTTYSGSGPLAAFYAAGINYAVAARSAASTAVLASALAAWKSAAFVLGNTLTNLAGRNCLGHPLLKCCCFTTLFECYVVTLSNTINTLVPFVATTTTYTGYFAGQNAATAELERISECFAKLLCSCLPDCCCCCN